jgi:hypothetical protein
MHSIVAAPCNAFDSCAVFWSTLLLLQVYAFVPCNLVPGRFDLYSKSLVLKVAAERQKKSDRMMLLAQKRQNSALSRKPSTCLHQGCIAQSVCGYIGPSRQVCACITKP